ncbi:GerAB/ArcD/ProY family transporter [Paenibacillus aceris]|uniref:Spore germination protein (Amino acid permease) n=1 Tax=Paenibacillus aceris TaxID=869555 RepID=A0ABS4I5W8_9BACL|nr:endospore germination permease [Paenibacillus aceris]MBP1966313.1 spore germination protein (amino acid permease) [Paenibacillus aceris]NHW38572.1 endospore germination permease [Paenibacillus aceris]
MTRMQLFAFILQTQVGIGVLSFPYVLHQAAGEDGWISVILAGACVNVLLIIYVALCKRFPGKNFYEFMPLILGKWIGNAVNAFYTFHFLFLSCLVLLMEMLFVELWILPFTNPWLVIAANFVILIYFAKERLPVIARYNTMVTFLLILMVAMMLTSFYTMDYRYLLPIGQKGWTAIIAGMKSSVITFLGFELFLIVSSEVQSNGKSMLTPVLWANTMATIFFLVVVLLCFLNFSPESIPFIPQPVPYYLNGISLPFLERMDLIFLSVWLVKVTASLISYMYAAGKGFGYWFHNNEHRKAMYYLVPIVCLVGFAWRSEKRIAFLQKVTEYESFILIGLPVLLFLFVWLKGKEGGKQQ